MPEALLDFLFQISIPCAVECAKHAFEIRPFRLHPGWLAAAAAICWAAVTGVLQFAPNPAGTFQSMAWFTVIVEAGWTLSWLLRHRRRKNSHKADADEAKP